MSGNEDDTFAKGGQSDSRHSGVKPPPISTTLGSSGGGDGEEMVDLTTLYDSKIPDGQLQGLETKAEMTEEEWVIRYRNTML